MVLDINLAMKAYGTLLGIYHLEKAQIQRAVLHDNPIVYIFKHSQNNF